MQHFKLSADKETSCGTDYYHDVETGSSSVLRVDSGENKIKIQVKKDAQPGAIEVTETVVLKYMYTSTANVFGSETITVKIGFQCPDEMTAETFEIDISDYNFMSSNWH